MTEEASDRAVSESGGTMSRLMRPPSGVVPDVSALASLRPLLPAAKLRPAVGPPFFDPGDVLTWHYGASVDVLRVVSDDERGLVAWLPAGSERVAATPRDGRGLRDRSLAERAALAVAGDYDLVVSTWCGPGLLRIAPAGRAWSIWYFRDDQGSFEGHYLNLELAHERPVDGARRTHTRDLVLDLWVEDGETWLKDADELEAWVAAGWCTEAQSAVVHDIAEQARREQVDPRTWPLDEAWEDWQPPAEWDEALTVPADVVADLSVVGPGRREGERG